MISLVAAMSKNRVIGSHGKLPWGKTMANDIKRYTGLIKGKTIVMGAKTYAGADHARNKSSVVVLSRKDLNLPKNVTKVSSVEELLELDSGESELFITGGGIVFKLMLQHADKVYLTVIGEEFRGDAFFPELDEAAWELTAEENFQKDANNKYDYSFLTYERIH